MATDDAAGNEIPGQAIYSPFFLKYVYDPLVVRFANRITWRCPASRLLKLYDAHVSSDHLDVGPGTGWFLGRCRFPSKSPRVALMDINENSLARASARLAKLNPDRLLANLMKPIDLGGRQFDSIGMTHVLHCIPASMKEKALVFQHLRPLLRPGGVLFGSTILSLGVPQTRMSRSQLQKMNESQVFSNVDDSLDGLRDALESNFSRHRLWAVGSVGLFTAYP